MHVPARTHAGFGLMARETIESRSDAKRALQQRHRDWLTWLSGATGLKPSQIATEANVSDSTLTRLLNNPAYKGALSQITIDRIKSRFSVAGPEEYNSGAGSKAVLGFSEAERLDPAKERGELAAVLGAMVSGQDAMDTWRLHTPALEAAGYLPGDLVLVDTKAAPRPHDIVCAQVADWQRGAAETVFRIYDPPFLIAASRENLAYKPLLVDGQRVIVTGVVVESYRPRRTAQRG
jgi:hypothetical protein